MDDNNKIIQPKPNRKSTLRLTQEFNEKYFTQFRQSLSITNFLIMKDDIKNFIKPIDYIVFGANGFLGSSIVYFLKKFIFFLFQKCV